MRLHPIVLCASLALFGCASTPTTTQPRVVAIESTIDVSSWNPPESEELTVSDRTVHAPKTYLYRLHEPNRREQSGSLHAVR